LAKENKVILWNIRKRKPFSSVRDDKKVVGVFDVARNILHLVNHFG